MNKRIYSIGHVVGIRPFRMEGNDVSMCAYIGIVRVNDLYFKRTTHVSGKICQFYQLNTYRGCDRIPFKIIDFHVHDSGFSNLKTVQYKIMFWRFKNTHFFVSRESSVKNVLRFCTKNNFFSMLLLLSCTTLYFPCYFCCRVHIVVHTKNDICNQWTIN